jgi:hypothetical protein
VKVAFAAAIAALALAGPAQAHMLSTSTPVKDMPAKQQLRYAQATIAHSKAAIAITKRRIRHDLRLMHKHQRTKRWMQFDATVQQLVARNDLRHARLVLHNHRWLLGYGYRLKRVAEARMNPWAVPAFFYSQAMCVHRGEGGWNANTGNGFGGGLQFMVGTWNHAASLSHGLLRHVKYTSQIAAMPPMAQIYAAYLIVVVERSGWGQWPNTARRCGLL